MAARDFTPPLCACADLVVQAVSPSVVDGWGACAVGDQWPALGTWRSQTRSKISSVLPLNQIWSS